MEKWINEKLKKLTKVKSEIEETKFLFKGTEVSEVDEDERDIRLTFRTIDDNGIKAIAKICKRHEVSFYISESEVIIF